MPPRGRSRSRGPGGRGASASGPPTRASSRRSTTAAVAGDDDSHEDYGDSTETAAAPSTGTDTTAANTRSSMAAPPSSQPRPSAQSIGTSSRGGATRGRLLPKAVRRGDRERQELAEQEGRKLSDKAMKEEARMKRESNFRSRRERGRGAPMGMRQIVTPQGPFSQLPGATGLGASGSHALGGFRDGGGGGRGGRGTATASSSTSRGASAKRSGRTTKKETSGSSGAFQEAYQDQEDDDRINIDTLNIHSGGGEEDAYDGQRLPLSIFRQEHKDPKIVVSTTADNDEEGVADDDSDGSDLFMEGANATTIDDNQVWSAAPKRQRIKVEGEEVTGIDTLAARRQKIATAKARKAAPEPAVEKPPPPTPPPQKLTLEQEIIQERLQRMLSELGIQDAAESREGRVYFFAFPPVLPPLQPITSDAQKTVKDEPEDDVVMFEDVAAATVDLTHESVVKEEEDINTKRAPKKPDVSRVPYDGEGGFLGTLNIRKSGKAELSFGGYEFTMTADPPKSRKEEVVLVEDFDHKKKTAEGSYAGQAYALGQIMGEFGTAPIWKPYQESSDSDSDDSE